MTTQRKFKTRVRERMIRTGESYTQALIATKRGGGEQRTEQPIVGWIVAGDAPRAYRFGVEPTEDDPLVRQARIECIDASTQGFGTLMQSLDSAEFRKKRVRWSAEVRCSGVVDFAALWMRVDGRSREVLAFDNMSQRPLRGTVEWTRIDVVLDVDEAAFGLAFGALLRGAGTICFRRAGFEPVSRDVAVTAPLEEPRPKQPRNLALDE